MDVVVFVLILILGAAKAGSFTRKSGYPHKYFIYQLWLYHVFFGVVYYFYSLSNSADSKHYWDIASHATATEIFEYIKEGSGTPFMYVSNYFPANILGLSYFSGTMIYAYIGFLGVLNFMKIAENYVPNNVKVYGFMLFPTIFLFPNLHFWSVAIGKDTISFFCVSLFCLSIINGKKNALGLGFSIILSYFIRPHITLMLLISFGFIYLFNGKLQVYQRIIFSVLLIGVCAFILPKVMEYTSLKDTSAEAIKSRFSNQAKDLNVDAGSGIDISSYPLVLKMFTFLYRPTFIDMNSIPSFIAAFENLILLILSYRAFRFSPLLVFKQAPFLVQGLFIFLILGTIIFGSSLGNLGVMIRMRNMFLPGFFIYIMWALSYQKQLKMNKNYNLQALKQKLVQS